MSVSIRLAERMLAIRPATLSDADIAQTQRLMLDLIGTAFRGSTKPWARSMQTWARRYDGAGAAGIIGTSMRTPAMIAALVNGTAGHSYELDDTHDLSLSHPGAVVIAAALAVASEIKATGAETLAAIVAGYETIARIGTAARGGHVIEHGHHPTALFGTFGAATVAAHLYGMDARQLGVAWGHALSLTGGSMQFSDEMEGTDIKRVHAGYAAKNGVLASELALHGVQAPHRALEGKYGFFKLYGHNPRLDVLEEEGKPLAVHTISLKPYACCRFFHSTIDALALLREEHGSDLSGIEAITVRGARVIGDQHMMRRPASPMAAQYSLPYVVGATLQLGASDFTAYEGGNLNNKDVLRWADLVQFEHDDELESVHPAHLGTEVEIVYRGNRRKARVLDSVGTPARPLDWNAISEKISGLVAKLDVALDVGALQSAITELPESADVSTLQRVVMVPEESYAKP